MKTKRGIVSSARTRRRGMACIYVALSLTVMLAFTSLAVDVGRVQVAKTELRRAADAAARAAAGGISSGIPAAQDNAVAIAAANTADGASIALVTANDIEFGYWDSSARTFSVLTGVSRSGANAVRVTARRIASRGTAIPLMFAQIVGQPTCDVSASAIACNAGNAYELIGLNGITVKNNLFAGTYNSTSTVNPTQSNYLNDGGVGSNAVITAKNNEAVGTVVLGPSGTSDLTPINGTVTLTDDIPWPDMPAAPVGAVDVSISGNTTYPGGTYNWNDVNFANNSTLSFSGPATVNITGDVIFAQNATITACNNIPANLKIYQHGNHSFGGSNANSVDITADLIGPGSDFSAKNSATVRGRMVFNTITAKNNLDFYYDEALVPIYTGTSGGISTVK